LSYLLAQMGNAKSAYMEHEGKRYKFAQRQARGGGAPYLVIKRTK